MRRRAKKNIPFPPLLLLSLTTPFLASRACTASMTRHPRFSPKFSGRSSSNRMDPLAPPPPVAASNGAAS